MKLIRASQSRAARGLLDWSQQTLADAAMVGIVTIRNFEAERGTPHRSTISVIQQAFETAGVEFIGDKKGGLGVRLLKPSQEAK